jgi:hypothetical protein
MADTEHSTFWRPGCWRARADAGPVGIHPARGPEWRYEPELEAAWIQHDLEAAAAYLAPEWVDHYAGICEAHGGEDFKRVAGAYLRAFPDLHISLHDAPGGR